MLISKRIGGYDDGLFANEFHAYTVSSIAAQAFGRSSYKMRGAGDSSFEIWNNSWKRADRHVLETNSANVIKSLLQNKGHTEPSDPSYKNNW